MKKIVFCFTIILFCTGCEFGGDDNDSDDKESLSADEVKCSATLSGDISKDVVFDRIDVNYVLLTSPEGESRIVKCWLSSPGDPMITLYVNEWYSTVANYDLSLAENRMEYKENDSNVYKADTASTDCSVTFTSGTEGTFKCNGLKNTGGSSITISNGKF